MKKKISIIISIALILITLIQMSSFAIEPAKNVKVYSKGKTDGLLIWNGARIHTYIAVYEKDGKEYPAYCLNRELPGVELGPQLVDINKQVSNAMVWRVVVNGYPYKSISELGCNTEDEAYLATKQAVYCILTDRDPNTYSPIGEAGERTLNALKQIVNAARSSGATKPSSELTINQQNSLWEIDNIDSKYISQTFGVSAQASINEYDVAATDNNIEGLKIVDENNNEKSTFKYNEKFKILLPITNATQDGNFVLEVSGKVATKAVLYGEAQETTLQNYAMTGNIYEDGIGSKKVYYTKNETKIIINKKDKKEENVLKGVEFELLDNDKNVLYTGLITDENGQIQIDNLLPGKYFIKETKTLLGYEIYNKLIEVDLELNETATVNVINSEKEEEIKIENKETELSVENTQSAISVKLPKTGM